MQVKILGIGDVVGKPGRMIIRQHLKQFVASNQIDLVVANGENLSGGSGLTPADADEMFASGVHVITGGDHVWGKKEIIPYIDQNPRLLRPANYPADNPGKGYTVVESVNGVRIGVIHVQGRVFMANMQADCPFKTAKHLCEEIAKTTRVIVIDMHAEATSEKIAIGWYLDGTASYIFGTHTHIQTADERVLPNGTAYITDLGMTGPYESVIGRRVDRVLHKFLTQMPSHFEVATEDVRLCGAIATIDAGTGRATDIRRVVIRENGEVKS